MVNGIVNHTPLSRLSCYCTPSLSRVYYLLIKMAAAEALISTIARAFYDDDVVCLIDVLIREKYLRDDDMVRMSYAV